jgi:K+-sensing histidine kinase KdpD
MNDTLYVIIDSLEILLPKQHEDTNKALTLYSVIEKNRKECNAYDPTVCVHSRQAGNKVEIEIQDNGTGIANSLMNKVFQPFFTTKPAGHGTGLGLSLSYDIIKAAGGEIKVESREDEFARFTVQLPYETELAGKTSYQESGLTKLNK